MTKRLLIRADASSEIGAGHIMRSLALAQAWQSRFAGAEVVFVSAECPAQLEDRLVRAGCVVEKIDARPGSESDVAGLLAAVQRNVPAWVVLDGYRFGDAYEADVAAADVKLLAWDDDVHAQHSAARLLLNQNPHARVEDYAAAAGLGVTLLLGPEYICLRQELLQLSARRDVGREGVERVLVMAGGADAQGATLLFLEALRLARIVPPDAIDVIIGGANQAKDEVARRASDLGHRVFVDVRNPGELMLQADLGLSAAGSATWEFAFLGVPTVVVPMAPNQMPIAEAVEQLGIGRAAAPLQEVTAGDLAAVVGEVAQSNDTLARMRRAAPEVVDGHGASRVVDAMEAPDCVLRRARLDDAEMLFSWANDSVTRSASFSSEPISWETHRAWLGAKLEDRGCLLFLATAGGGRPVGQLRLDLEGDAAEISVSVGPEHRGLGFGRRLITAGLHEAFRQTGVANVRALIKPENTASVRAFEATGFKRVGETARRGHAAWVFEVARGSFNA